MVESECHVAAETTERYEHIVFARNGFFGFERHIGLGVALFVFGHFVDELARRRAVFIDTRYVGAVFHFLVEHIDGHIEMIWRRGVYDVETDAIAAFFGGEEYEVFFRACKRPAAIGACYGPAVCPAGKRRRQGQFLHASDTVDRVESEADGGKLIGASSRQTGHGKACDTYFQISEAHIYLGKKAM